MSNPIFSPFNSPQQKPVNSLSEMYNEVRNSPNPNKTMERLLYNNPTFREIMTYISENGGNAKAAFYNMAAQKGIDPNSVLNKLR